MATQLFSAEAYLIINRARDLMRRLFLQTTGEPGPEHVLLALLQQGGPNLEALQRVLAERRYVFERYLFEHTLKMDEPARTDSRERFLLEIDRLTANRLARYAHEGDLLVAALRAESEGIRAALAEAQLDERDVLRSLAMDEPGRPKLFARGGRRSQEPVKAALAILDQFGNDLVAQAQLAATSVRFRDEAIAEVLATLCRQQQNNVLLVGESGVGKSALITALGQRLPKTRLAGRPAYRLSLTRLAAGATDRRELEERIRALVAECQQRNALVVLDDFAAVFAADNRLAEFPTLTLRQGLLSGAVQCLVECTPEWERKFRQADAELAEIWSTTTIPELSRDQTLEILASVAPDIEKFHNVRIGRETLVAAIELGDRHVADRKMPGKALGLLDAAAATVSLRPGLQRAVGPEDVAGVVSKLTGLDAARLLSYRVEDLRQVEACLKARIIGQDDAIRQLVDTIQLARSGLSLRPHRPDAVFLLAGPTGVGKTELAKCLSEALQGSPNKLVRFDMSEFMEEHSVAKLIGAPPGYIGFDREARLCRQIRANPRAVVLLDEIEKAHPNLQHLFLQIFDDGRLTDAQGQTADFSQTVILMTSNLGARELRQAASREELHRICEAAVREFFTPEFLNRLDGIVPMNFLEPAAINRIAELQLRTAFDPLAAQGKSVTVNNSAFDLVVSEGYNPAYGARHLGRVIENRILKPLAKFLLDHPQATALCISAANNQVQIEVTP